MPPSKIRYQVFLSSTYVDLIEERNSVLQVLLEMDFIPCGMELFPAADEDQWSLIKKVIDECDYYILLVAGRYGSLGPTGKSYTEMEYDYAIASGKPVIAFLHSKPNTLPNEKCEQTEEGRRSLNRFRTLCQNKLCKMWDNPESLGGIVYMSLEKLVKSKPGVGWIRADEVKTKEIDKRLKAQDFFYTLDQKGETSFPYLVNGAKKVRILARTSVNLLSQYGRLFHDMRRKGCHVQLLYINPESEAKKYVYGSNSEAFEQNLKQMELCLKSLRANTDLLFEAKSILHAPTFSLIMIEKDDEEESFAIVQLYFLHSRVARDRPLFRVDKSDIWYSAFSEEFDQLWDSAVL